MKDKDTWTNPRKKWRQNTRKVGRTKRSKDVRKNKDK